MADGEVLAPGADLIAAPALTWNEPALVRAIRETLGVAEGPGGQFSLVVDRSSSGRRNQDPKLALAVLPELMEHYPELLGNVYVAPVNSLFFAVWRVIKIFLSAQTKRKFVLVPDGPQWREELRERVGFRAGWPYGRPRARAFLSKLSFHHGRIAALAHHHRRHHLERRARLKLRWGCDGTVGLERCPAYQGVVCRVQGAGAGCGPRSAP